MEIKKFKTLVKRDHKLFGEYTEGRINGLLMGMCHGPFGKPYAIDVVDAGNIHTAVCTQEKYDLFTKAVERWYPGMCEFNYIKK